MLLLSPLRLSLFISSFPPCPPPPSTGLIHAVIFGRVVFPSFRGVGWSVSSYPHAMSRFMSLWSFMPGQVRTRMEACEMRGDDKEEESEVMQE